ncbi:hypothetical protein ACXR0O_20495 [Verrucomicrobiota bacterium sgz303538]
MNWAFQLSPEERYLAKRSELDSLEQIAQKSADEVDVAGAYERIFDALDQRPDTSTETVLDWGQRYMKWACSYSENDGLPFLGTEWAKRLYERSISAKRPDIALRVADAVLRSYAPLEKERNWWMKQHYTLSHNDSV